MNGFQRTAAPGLCEGAETVRCAGRARVCTHYGRGEGRKIKRKKMSLRGENAVRG